MAWTVLHVAVLNGLIIYHHRLKKSTFERTHTGIIIPFTSYACYINDMAVFSFIPMKRICQWLTYKTSRFAIIHEFTCFCAFIMLECASKNFSITRTFYIWMEKKVSLKLQLHSTVHSHSLEIPLIQDTRYKALSAGIYCRHILFEKFVCCFYFPRSGRLLQNNEPLCDTHHKWTSE